MFYLGYDFIVSSLIWLSLIAAFVFTFRKQILAFFYKDTSFNVFTSNLKIYLEKTYPNIKFDYSIIETSKSEPNPEVRKYLIADNIITQYQRIQLDKSKFPKSTPQKLLWSGYVFNCEPNKNKLPNDWAKRKNALFLRDKKRCFRCSKYIDINSMKIYMIKSLEDGGKYYLENLLPVCSDCEKILSKDPKKSGNLEIKDRLYDIVEKS